jgi:hypothetical protein
LGVVRCGLQRATELCLKIRWCRTVLAHTVNSWTGTCGDDPPKKLKAV